MDLNGEGLLEPPTLGLAPRAAYDPDHMPGPGSSPPADLVPPALRHAAEDCAFDARQVLGRQGDAPRHMYCVRQGEVQLLRTGRDGELVLLQRVRRGWVAEASLLAPRYHCDLVAATATTCARVPVRVVRDMLASSPAFARDWVAMLSAEVRRLRGACERMGLRSAEQRVVHAIESEGQDGALRPATTIKDWAAELGLTHEALYRTLARMEAQGRLRNLHGTLQLVGWRSR